MPDSERHGYQRLAWDGFAFEVPDNWHLAAHDTRRPVSRLELEDDLARRMELEWTRDHERRPAVSEKIRRRYDELAGELRAQGCKDLPVTDLPPGWSASLYTFPDDRRLLTAFRLPGDGLFCIFKMHFDRASFREPLRIIRRLADSFTIYGRDAMVWDFLDVAFKINGEYRLTGLALMAGSKLMAFEWHWRRLFVWVFSPADVIVARERPEEYCARVLNRYKEIRGALFLAGKVPGILEWRRDWRYVFGRFEDLFRHCHRYRVECRLREDKNQLLLMVYHYRTEADLPAMRVQWL